MNNKIRFDNVYIADNQGGMILMFDISEDKPQARRLYQQLKESNKKYCFEVKEYRKGRSLNANAYFRKLCNELADKLSNENLTTSEEIYRGYIKTLGIYKDAEVSENAADTLMKAWSMNGLGWISEKVDFSDRDGFVIVRLYYGSSVFNTKQMSRLIDLVVQDCQAVGIETMTQQELSLLKEAWGK